MCKCFQFGKSSLKYGAFEYTVGEGENADYRQHFLIFPQCFLAYGDQFHVRGIFLFVVYKCFHCGKCSLKSHDWVFENIVEKGENADVQHFLHFPQCFLAYGDKFKVLGIIFCRL